MTMNHAATIGPCGPRARVPGGAGGASAGGGGTGPRSGWKRYALCVTGSTVIVFAPRNVSTVATFAGAKTIAVDPVTHNAYLFQPERGPAPAPPVDAPPAAGRGGRGRGPQGPIVAAWFIVIKQ